MFDTAKNAWRSAPAADPLREHAPEHTAAAEDFDLREYRRAGGREAGDGLEHGIEIIRDVPAEDKWQRAEQRHGYSHQPDRHEALARIEIL